jgi:hypothetical protein
MARKLDETSHVRVRIDPIRLAKLQKQADKNSRSLTTEIMHHIDQGLARGGLTATLDLEKLSDQIAAKVVAALKGDKK